MPFPETETTSSPETDPLTILLRLRESRLGPRMQAALVYLLEGASYREACKAVGYSEKRAPDLHRAARRHGVAEWQAIRSKERWKLLEEQSKRYIEERLRAAKESWYPNAALPISQTMVAQFPKSGL